MAKLTNVQRRTLDRALLDLERAQRFLLLPEVAVARKCGRATTALHYTRADGLSLYEVSKESGSLAGLFSGITTLRQLLTDERPASEAQNPVAAPSPLPRHVEMLMLEAARTTGTLKADEFLPCIEERLTLEECETVRAFLGWLTRHGLTFGHGNIQARYAAFRAVAHPAWLLS